MSTHTPHTDISPEGFISGLKEPWRSYALLARFDRFRPTWLLFLPGISALFLPSTGIPLTKRLLYTAFFAVGSITMRSAGCIINDIWDRDLDAQVVRTAQRPLASKKLTIYQALIFLLLLLIIGLLILIQLPVICWILAPVALLLVALYPLAKRFTWWPQLIMGFTFGFGAPMGYAAAYGSLNLSGFLLYAAVIIWQLGFDTIYGFQDMEDDARIGIKSTSRLMQNHPRTFILTCYVSSLVLFGLSSLSAHQNILFWYSFIPASLCLLYQGYTITPKNPQKCLKQFRNNIPIGFLIALSFILGHLI